MYGGLVGTMSPALQRGDLLSTKNLGMRHRTITRAWLRRRDGLRRMSRSGANGRFLVITARMDKLGAQSLAGCAAGVLREPHSRRFEAGV